MQTLEEPMPTESSSQGPLFVVGMWRSGTSLFYALLNQHPQIGLLYEGDLALLWPLFLRAKVKQDWAERWDFWNLGATRHQLDLSGVSRHSTSFRGICEAVWKQYAGPVIGGEKSPNYFDILPKLAREFPNARFIVIWRNPADVCRSIVRASSDSFFGKSGMILRGLLGCRELKTGFDVLVAQGMPVHEVQYENLIEDPSQVMAGVCRFLGLPFDSRMANLRNADRSAIYNGEHHEMVKSESISPRARKEEVLPERVLRKIDRYIVAWHEQYGGTWPARPESDGRKPSPWFALEQMCDRLVYRSLRSFDQAVVLLYSFAPLSLLKKYREMRGRGETVPVKQASKEALVEMSVKD
jgi:Sulfotransferase family